MAQQQKPLEPNTFDKHYLCNDVVGHLTLDQGHPEETRSVYTPRRYSDSVRRGDWMRQYRHSYNPSTKDR